MNLNTVDLRLLKVFLAVVQAGGFTRAAEHLNIGRPTVSTHIADLERRLGMRLCERGRAGFSLTDRGEQVYDSLLQLTVALDEFTTSIDSIHGHLSGEVNIGQIDYMTSVPEFRMSDVLHRFGAEAPKVKINLQVLPEEQVTRGVLEGRLHFGIVTERNCPETLLRRTFLHEENILYCGSKHRLSARSASTITQEDLLRSSFVGPNAPTTNSRWPEVGNKVDAFTNNLEATLTLILSGHYLGYLPEHFAKAWVERGELQSLRPEMTSYTRELVVVTRKGLRKSQRLERFLTTLFEAH